MKTTDFKSKNAFVILYGKILNLSSIIDITFKIVNFIRLRSLKRRLFKL